VSGTFTTDADRLADHYRKIGEAEKHVYGGHSPGAPNYNIDLDAVSPKAAVSPKDAVSPAVSPKAAVSPKPADPKPPNPPPPGNKPPATPPAANP
jgi:hypothetical protein